jgi:DTW domain-containing protein YfiP
MPSAEPTTRPRCLRCHRPAVTCVCADLPRVANRTGVHILQHPRERFHPVGTAPLARLGLARCTLEVPPARLTRSVACALELPARTALLYPAPDAVDLADLRADERPEHLLVLDGTWRQAKRLYLENPWLREIPHVRLSPDRPSRYRVRKPPGAQFLSTLESILEALRILEPETPGFDELLDAFERMNARQEAYMYAADRTPRRERPKRRASRRVPAELSAAGLAVVYAELVPTSCATTAGRELLQWVAVRADGACFEALIRPGTPLPAERALVHLGFGPETLAAGRTLAAAREDFAAFLGADAVLAAWNNLPLELARERLGFAGPTVLLKAAYTNVRGGRCGALEEVVVAEGLAVEPLPFAGRAARRAAEALAIAGWLRTARDEGPAEITPPTGEQDR